ncbi:armadillo repeat-containing protein 1-like isoform X1 [Alosa alosa]|uniref:armadillo repeat-containing protein 1-like isoform X1 n=1 Tax=Alosa alosa TaxID=278164 RepID=UPI00201524BD|nr:armadillo repeat-containing protein 1-like isoform X1 [Alosa alosa]
MGAEPDALAVAQQLRELAADPLNRRAIVEDRGCLPGLILLLDNSNPQVVYTALQALRFLAECRSNREKMRTELGMMLSLQNVTHKVGSPGETCVCVCTCRVGSPGETCVLAAEVLERLRAVCEEEEEGAELPYSCRRPRFFLGNANKRAKTLTLHIHGLDDTSRRSVCEEALLKVRGVISFTFQMELKRCIIRIRSDLTAETLGAAISSTGVLTAQQVVKREDGSEVLIPCVADECVCAVQGVCLPEYLPEDESPAVEAARAVSGKPTNQEAAGWVNTATNFLSRSFYW